VVAAVLLEAYSSGTVALLRGAPREGVLYEVRRKYSSEGV
jgi:hypothetical protein